MYAYIKGQLTEIGTQDIIVESGDIGYYIFVPTSMISELPPLGDKIKIYTYLHVKEDAMILFGFTTKEDKYIFERLISVNGIGPKSGIGVLSVMTGQELRMAVLTDDVKKICLAPGIGKKTAQKLILDLKDKFKIESTNLDLNSKAVNQMVNTHTIIGEAVEALLSLGYSNQEAHQSVKGLEDIATVEGIIGAALKKLAIF